VSLFAAVAEGDAEGLRQALEADPSLAATTNEDGVSLVRWALYQGRRDLAAMVLAAEPTLDIFDAASVGDTDRVDALLAEDATLATVYSGDGFTALHFAAFLGTSDVASALLDAGADPAARAIGTMDVEPLHSAAAAQNLAVSRLLVDRGAPVNDTQEGGFTPLHEAALNGDTELVSLLLGAGADPSIATDEGRRPADLARQGGHDDLATELDTAAEPA
jgi:uncharacterized protein